MLISSLRVLGTGGRATLDSTKDEGFRKPIPRQWLAPCEGLRVIKEINGSFLNDVILKIDPRWSKELAVPQERSRNHPLLTFKLFTGKANCDKMRYILFCFFFFLQILWVVKLLSGLIAVVLKLRIMGPFLWVARVYLLAGIGLYLQSRRRLGQGGWDAFACTKPARV